MTNLASVIPTQKERLIAGVSHLFVLIPFLGFLAPRIIWATQKDKSQYVAFQSFQAFIYQVITLVVWLIGMILFFALPIFGIWLVAPTINLIVYFIFAAYGIFGAIMAFQGKPFRYLIISDRVEHSLSTFTDKQWRIQFREVQKHPFFPFAVGFGIVCIHFAITNLLKNINFASFGYVILLMLISPSYITLILEFALPSISEFINSSTELPILISSLFYGIVGGFLASRNVYLQSMGVIFIFLLILSGCFLLMLAGQFFA